MSRSTRDELANILQTSYKSMIVEDQGSKVIEIIEDDDL